MHFDIDCILINNTATYSQFPRNLHIKIFHHNILATQPQRNDEDKFQHARIHARTNTHKLVYI